MHKTPKDMALPYAEYAISKGEGTLIEYGVLEFGEREMKENIIDAWAYGFTVIFDRCEGDCETGQ